MRVEKNWAERFIDWYPTHTKLYLKGEHGKTNKQVAAMREELFEQLVLFFDELQSLRVPQDKNSGLNATIGKWPGDETDEQIQEALDATAKTAGDEYKEKTAAALKETYD